MDFNNSIHLLNKSLDLTWQKQKIITDNIANIDTPGYKAKYANFEDELRARLLNSDTKDEVKNAISSTRGEINVSEEETDRLDGNNVNIEAENIELARTQIQYDYLVRQITGQFTMLETVING